MMNNIVIIIFGFSQTLKKKSDRSVFAVSHAKMVGLVHKSRFQILVEHSHLSIVHWRLFISGYIA